jgi:NAD(P)-dependent dehydrogenase (short-subunit alcohol dehydrogenase family)
VSVDDPEEIRDLFSRLGSLDHLVFTADGAAMYDSLSEALPVGRVGEVSDSAETFLYLMRNGYSSGTMVTVDGGSVRV